MHSFSRRSSSRAHTSEQRHQARPVSKKARVAGRTVTSEPTAKRRGKASEVAHRDVKPAKVEGPTLAVFVAALLAFLAPWRASLKAPAAVMLLGAIDSILLRVAPKESKGLRPATLPGLLNLEGALHAARSRLGDAKLSLNCKDWGTEKNRTFIEKAIDKAVDAVKGAVEATGPLLSKTYDGPGPESDDFAWEATIHRVEELAWLSSGRFLGPRFAVLAMHLGQVYAIMKRTNLVGSQLFTYGDGRSLSLVISDDSQPAKGGQS